MTQEVQTLSKLQEIDRRIAALELEIAELPRRVGVIRKQLDAHTKLLEADKAALAANQRERKKLDGDIQGFQAKISKLRDQVLLAKNNEQYNAFQKEITFCQSEIGKSEDSILSLLAASEALDQNVQVAEAAFAAEAEQVQKESKAAQARTAVDRAEVAKLTEERKGVATGLTPAMLALYARLRKKHKNGIVVAEAINSTCVACNMMIRPAMWQEMRSTDKLFNCESCGRVVYYHPPVAVDTQAGAAVL